ncbi:hypothetical protein CGCSCA1_v009548 [Colletotrichum siamense]|nr:hypothetical protein CGCSCA1_v009548 [Colletotrichum siamense]
MLLSAYSSDYFSRVHQLPETDLHHHLGDLQHPRREIPRQARCHPLTSTHPFRPTNRAKSSTLFTSCGLNLRPHHPKPPKPKSEKPREARRSRPKIPPQLCNTIHPCFSLHDWLLHPLKPSGVEPRRGPGLVGSEAKEESNTPPRRISLQTTPSQT